MDGVVVGKPDPRWALSHNFWKLVTMENLLQLTYKRDRTIVSNKGYYYRGNSSGWGKSSCFCNLWKHGRLCIPCRCKAALVHTKWREQVARLWPQMAAPQDTCNGMGTRWKSLRLLKRDEELMLNVWGKHAFLICEEQVVYECTLFQFLQTRRRATQLFLHAQIMWWYHCHRMGCCPLLCIAIECVKKESCWHEN